MFAAICSFRPDIILPTKSTSDLSGRVAPATAVLLLLLLFVGPASTEHLNMDDEEAKKEMATELSNMGDEEAKKETANGTSPRIASMDRQKGGFRAASFTFALMGLENMGFIANMVSLVLYFNNFLCMNMSSASTSLTNFMGSAFLLALVGAFISDTYLTRVNTCLIFGCLEVMALAMMTIQARSPHLHPRKCNPTEPTGILGGKAVYLYATLSLLALGAGGVKGVLPALGANQFDQKNPAEAKSLATYFNWLLLSTTTGACIGVTVIVTLSTKKGWHWGFFISTVCTFFGFIILAMGIPFYRIQPLGKEGPMLRVARVFILAIKNRKLSLPNSPANLFENTDKEERVAHTEQFSFLDKAAIVPKDSKPEPGNVCSVTQVEEAKILVRMLPILGSTILVNTCMAQLQTFSVLQGYFMNPHLGRLSVPAPSIPVIPLLFISILLPVYEFVFVPFARKITGHPTGITQLQRVGVGLVLSEVSMAIAGFIEVKRRDNFKKGHIISLFWLSFQYGIFGIADMFTLVGLLHFFYQEAPIGMRSLSTSFTWLSLSFGYFLSTILVNVINTVTQRLTASKTGWLHGQDLGSSKLHQFYWFLAILSILNFGLYLWAASWYKYKKEETGLMTPEPSISDPPPSGLYSKQPEEAEEKTVEEKAAAQ